VKFKIYTNLPLFCYDEEYRTPHVLFEMMSSDTSAPDHRRQCGCDVAAESTNYRSSG
jgi:hypothetical protein